MHTKQARRKKLQTTGDRQRAGRRLSHWSHEEMPHAGFEVVLMEILWVKVALQVIPTKTDCQDVEGIAWLLQIRWCSPDTGFAQFLVSYRSGSQASTASRRL